MITKINALQSLRPGAQWSLSNDVITWHDTNYTQPSDTEIEAEIAKLTALEPARIATENRRAAYITESDPLFFKMQRGEVTMEEWQEKVIEIRTRFPKE
jgi:hypothetical protein